MAIETYARWRARICGRNFLVSGLLLSSLLRTVRLISYKVWMDWLYLHHSLDCAYRCRGFYRIRTAMRLSPVLQLPCGRISPSVGTKLCSQARQHLADRVSTELHLPSLPISFSGHHSLPGSHSFQHKCLRAWACNGPARCLGAWPQLWFQSHTHSDFTVLG